MGSGGLGVSCALRPRRRANSIASSRPAKKKSDRFVVELIEVPEYRRGMVLPSELLVLRARDSLCVTSLISALTGKHISPSGHLRNKYL